jgi:hypothetical protein
VGYENDSSLVLQGKGTGGPEEVRDHLQDDKVQYFIVRVFYPKDNAETTRDVFVAWTGPKVARVAAAKKATHAGVVQSVLKVRIDDQRICVARCQCSRHFCFLSLQPSHAQITCVNKNKLTLGEVLDKSAPLSGSHHIE